MEAKPPAASRVSSSLPRSYQRSDSERLTSVVTPRPFGTQTSRIASLPRAFTVDEAQKRVNGGVDPPRTSSVPSRYQQFITSEDEARSRSSSFRSSEDEEEEKKKKEPEVRSEAPVSPDPAKDSSQGGYCERRISLNQKPNSSKDFGFQATWDSTGARVTSVHPGSQADMCQLQPGDEVLTVNGHQVAAMSYTDWRGRMDEALQDGGLVIDIRRHGSDSSPDTNAVNASLDFTSRVSTETLPPSKDVSAAATVVDVASNGVNGGFRDEPLIMRAKESEPISLKNLKRRSEFFEQGGSEPAVADIPVPSITPTSSRWSWDPEEERRRQEKWQKEQERLLQEKYKRDQEKLQEEWLRDQQEINRSVEQPQPQLLEEVNSHSVSPLSPLSPLGQPTPPATPPWEEQAKEEEEEERRRKEEQEEQERQRLEQERRTREEQEQRELRRLQEEKERRERREEEKRREEERKREEEEELRWQRRRAEEQRRRQEAAEQQRREQEREMEQQQWAKSKSSPQLDEEPQRKVSSRLGEVRGQQHASLAELERQQILNEMKKKTPLLTDSSWIRQRPASTAPSKDYDLPLMRRGESLDNLDSSYNSRRSSWNARSAPGYPRPHSALSGLGGGGGPRARPDSSTLPSFFSTGSLRSRPAIPPWSRQSTSPSPSSLSPATSPEPTPEGGAPPQQQRSRSVSGRKICTFCATPLGKGAAMIIESLGLCYHLGCFKCIDCQSDLGGSEAGAEVRIRNKQLYCNSCYMRFKAAQPTSM